ncbi:MAG: hypothetical protein U5M51_10980 [Emticicia sp.]|nr:hypothetical protein [Emticicia sp.]
MPSKELAARSYASVSAPDSIVALLKMWDKLPSTENAALLKRFIEWLESS